MTNLEKYTQAFIDSFEVPEDEAKNLKYQDTSDYIKSLSPKSTKSLGNFTFSNSTEILSGEPAINNYFSDKILREEEENFNQQKIIY